jgi:hypothetical protein
MRLGGLTQLSSLILLVLGELTDLGDFINNVFMT